EGADRRSHDGISRSTPSLYAGSAQGGPRARISDDHRHHVRRGGFGADPAGSGSPGEGARSSPGVPPEELLSRPPALEEPNPPILTVSAIVLFSKSCLATAFSSMEVGRKRADSADVRAGNGVRVHARGSQSEPA